MLESEEASGGQCWKDERNLGSQMSVLGAMYGKLGESNSPTSMHQFHIETRSSNHEHLHGFQTLKERTSEGNKDLLTPLHLGKVANGISHPRVSATTRIFPGILSDKREGTLQEATKVTDSQLTTD